MKNNTFKILFFAGLLLAASSAQAVIVDEYFSWIQPEWNWGEGEFVVTNDSAEDIYMFAVGNDEALSSNTQNGLNWDSQIVSSFNWNIGQELFLGGAQPVLTTDIGDFSTLFPGFTYVFMYNFDSNLTSTGAIAAGTTEGGFMFETGFPFSPFIAVGQAGNIIANGQTVHVVPLPAAVWLFGFGLAAVGMVGRRRT
ncbi:hypothetical protein MNBD_GAMMA25-209 [hydrothermal vent metagenome]|uniref:PEP-CTERM protein-sorting domain-containing protein n=1 Tax=hydrothermal vent metagenome TaxID=652676 RepID=A0A3B1BF45_9ZZZZ